MTLWFDHLVHAVPSPEDAVLAMEALGIHAVPGGKHSNGGTYNALAYFGLSYIEFLGIYDADAAKLPNRNALPGQVLRELARGGGLIRCALRTLDIEGVADRLRKAGIPAEGPVRLGRVRPDGKELVWTLLFPKTDVDRLQLPFFIQWDESDAQRENDLRANGSIAPHPAGNLRLSQIDFIAGDLDETLSIWSTVLGLVPVDRTFDEAAQADVALFRLPNIILRVSSPRGAGHAADRYGRRGEGPYAVGITGSDGDTVIHSYYNAVYRIG